MQWMCNLSGKTALVTGASGDIGEASARLLHKLGASVIITGTNIDKLEALRSELVERCEVKPCNLRDQGACNGLIEDLSSIDILVCNAGITKDMLSIKMAIDDWQDVIDVNLTANFILNKAAVKKMIRARYGRIVNISSVVGIIGNPGQANYCASKSGIIGMSKALAHEVAMRNITVNCVAPGFVTSNMTNHLTDAQKEIVLSKIPMKRYGEPIDIANIVAFLVSDEASYITGQTIHVNGGMAMI